jgi:ribosomal protein S27E
MFPPYAWPGGYPIVYLDAGGNVLCAECATANDEFSEELVAWAVEEGPDDDVRCDHCGKIIAEGSGDDD